MDLIPGLGDPLAGLPTASSYDPRLNIETANGESPAYLLDLSGDQAPAALLSVLSTNQESTSVIEEGSTNATNYTELPVAPMTHPVIKRSRNDAGGTRVSQDWLSEFDFQSGCILTKESEDDIDKINRIFRHITADHATTLPSADDCESLNGYNIQDVIPTIDAAINHEFVLVGEEEPFEEDIVFSKCAESLLKLTESELDELQDFESFPPNDYPEQNGESTQSISEATPVAKKRVVSRHFTFDENVDDDIEDFISRRLIGSHGGGGSSSNTYSHATTHRDESSSTSSLNRSRDLEFNHRFSSASIMDVFKPGGVRGLAPGSPRLQVNCEVVGSTASLTCLSCPDVTKPFQRLNNLAKHIESAHCRNSLVCLLCKANEKGQSISFPDTTAAFVHAMENHNTSEFKYFVCDFCQLLVLGGDQIEAHIQTSHPRQNPDSIESMRRYPCLLCLFPFKHTGHRVDHFKANHKMDIKAFFVRRPKKQYGPASKTQGRTNQSRASSANDEEKRVKAMLKETKLEMTAARREERLRKKQARENRQKRKLLNQKLQDRSASGSTSTSISEVSEHGKPLVISIVRRKALKPELKDKYADILRHQPKVVLTDFLREHFVAGPGKCVQDISNFVYRCSKAPVVLVERL